MKQERKVWSTILIMAMILTLLLPFVPAEVFAADVVDSGTCGDDLTWTLDSEGTLTISGTGEMYDFFSYDRVPWYGSQSLIIAAIIEDGVTSIGRYAFGECDNLTSVTIPSGVTYIGNGAFRWCRSLISVILPESLTSIGDEAFYLCHSLSTVEFLGDAPNIGDSDGLFPSAMAGKFTIIYHSGTTGWTSPTWNGYYAVCIDEEISDFSTLDADNRNPQGLLFTLNDSAKTASVGDNSTTKNNSGYYGMGGGQVVIPTAVTKDGTTYSVISVDQYAFSENSFVKAVGLGAKLTSVDPTAFSDCPNFAAFSVAEGNLYYTAIDGVLYDKGVNNLYIYPDGNPAEYYRVPDSVGVIGKNVFYNNPYVREIVVPDSVVAIGESAFGWCENLETITLPFLVDRQFAIGGPLCTFFSYSGVPDSLRIVTITGGELYSSSFQNCWNVEEINLPNVPEEIPDYCFAHCENLKILRFGEQEVEPGKLVIPEGVKTISNYAFAGCDGFSSVSIPSSVININNTAFYNCAGNEGFTVAEDNPAYMADKWGVLYETDNRTLINYPAARKWPYYNVSDGTEQIATYAFYGCGNLKNLCVPQSVTTMNSSCIQSCPGMTVCAWLDSVAYQYAANNSINVWPMDNYALQGIEIFGLPEQTVYQMGQEGDFEGLYVVANGGKALQADNYTLSYNKNYSGTQLVTVTYEGKTAQFPITLYSASETTVDCGEYTAPGDSETVFLVIYDENGRMLDVGVPINDNGRATLITSKTNGAKAVTRKQFVLDKATWSPVRTAAVSS